MGKRTTYAMLAAGLLVLALGVGAVIVYLTRSTSSSTPGAFVELWDSSPSTPEVWDPSDWLILSHWRDPVNWENGKAVDVHHDGATCGGVTETGLDPGTMHHISTRPEGRYLCNGHLMSGLDGQEYGLIYFMPPAMVDFSSGPGTISWDLSTLATSNRDWVDVWVTPYEDDVAAPFEPESSLNVDFQGVPRNGLWVKQVNGAQWVVHWIADDVVTEVGVVDVPAGPKLPSAAHRSPMEITLTPTTVSFGFLPDAGFTDGNVTTFTLPSKATWRQGTVKFGHHSYNPLKDCPTTGMGAACTPSTWHWDNVRIEPSVPLAIERAAPEVVIADSSSADTPQTVSWTAAAPADAVLKFSGLCQPRIRFDAKEAFVEVPLAPFQGQGSDGVTRAVEHASSWQVAVPEGATSAELTFTADDWYDTSHGCLAEGFAVVAR